MKTTLPISEIHALMQSSNALGWVWQRVEENQNVQWSLVQAETGSPLHVYAVGAVLTAETRAIVHLLPILLESIVDMENVNAEVLQRLEFVYLAFTTTAERLREIEQLELYEQLMLFNRRLKDAMNLLKQSFNVT
ncbi:hypothetical protein H8K52_14190 [Undibacterium seohonense]|uniref:Uncharacterized protein n=1 Tax=Undibacterium seohonense TaxID=1344950 RepID=A0ABR6X6B3_9BURK|nr:hypothetical protein [Undibacterium seohonense]MBC3808490.1 hypothetical protein [Undibacterium seohonense]